MQIMLMFGYHQKIYKDNCQEVSIIRILLSRGALA